LIVNPQEIHRQLRRTPFVPFRVHTSDGKTLDIKLPELAFLTRSLLLVARPVKDPTKEIPARFDEVSMLHVVRVEPLVAA
jgi:hypothetical protein